MQHGVSSRRARDFGIWLWREEQLPQRIFFYLFGLFIAAFAVALMVNSGLGLSPISSFPFVISRITDSYMGIWVTAMLIVFLALQIAILRKEFKWINLTQMIFAAIFGYFVDFTQALLGDFLIPTYFGRLAMLGISIILIAIGIVFFLDQKLATMPAEALLEAIIQKYPHHKFHRLKIVMDSSMALFAAILSLIFLGNITGLREGTFITALLVGKLMPSARTYVTNPILKKAGMQLRQVSS
jgi:uncharacterized membrane protein YczE